MQDPNQVSHPVAVSPRRVVAILRKYLAASPDRAPGASPEIFGLALLRALGDAGSGYLERVGLSRDEIDAVMPNAEEKDYGRYPAAQPDPALKQLLEKDLKGFFSGKQSGIEAARVIFAEPRTVDRARQLVQGAASRQKPTSAETIRSLVHAFEQDYHYGCKRYLHSGDTASDYARGLRDAAFEKGTAKTAEQKCEYRRHLYYDPDLPFEDYMRVYGPLAADMLLVIATNSVVPYMPDGRAMQLREVAWTVDPARYLCICGEVLDTARKLQVAGFVRIYPEPDEIHLISQALATRQLIDEFCRVMSIGP